VSDVIDTQNIQFINRMPSTSVFSVSGNVDVLSERRRKRKHRWHVLEFIPGIRFGNTLQTPNNLYIEVTRGWNR